LEDEVQGVWEEELGGRREEYDRMPVAQDLNVNAISLLLDFTKTSGRQRKGCVSMEDEEENP
jgi:hypothetical protein